MRTEARWQRIVQMSKAQSEGRPGLSVRATAQNHDLASTDDHPRVKTRVDEDSASP